MTHVYLNTTDPQRPFTYTPNGEVPLPKANYRVTFTYTVEVWGQDEEHAEDEAYQYLSSQLPEFFPLASLGLAAYVEEMA